MNGRARLLSRACTTGWGDWIHGELWLLPSSLVRRRLGFMATVANGKGPTVVWPLPEADVTEAAVARIRAEHRTNTVLPLADIASARIHRGFASARVSLRMKDGAHHKLLWPCADPAYDVLVDVLAPWLRRP
ncbi:hypothetical protein [Streptomyces sp. NBC_00385]|uniref:hypothetical protein n=1 Tax=Streptomyces sp. NBC_00385 TaxID=2975733 RepID=UPI002DDC0DAF|nr:hypothetical protein [Streptomyces sp. NBC_00385]WRZ06514.1 hypothetical protein OG959_25825 [Streptomyces sp. NBC_00385]